MLPLLKIVALVLVLVLQAFFIAKSVANRRKLFFLVASALCVFAALLLNIAKASGAS